MGRMDARGTWGFSWVSSSRAVGLVSANQRRCSLLQPACGIKADLAGGPLMTLDQPYVRDLRRPKMKEEKAGPSISAMLGDEAPERGGPAGRRRWDGRSLPAVAGQRLYHRRARQLHVPVALA